MPFSPFHPGAKAAPWAVLRYSILSLKLPNCVEFLLSFVLHSAASGFLWCSPLSSVMSPSPSLTRKNTQGWCDLLGCRWHDRSPDHLTPLACFVHSGVSVLSFEAGKQPLGRLSKLCRGPVPHHSSLPSSSNQTLLESLCRLPSTPILSMKSESAHHKKHLCHSVSLAPFLPPFLSCLICH